MRAASIALTLLVTVGCATSHKSFQYAVVTEESVRARDASVDAQRLAQLRQSIGRDFVWFNRQGGEYIVTSAVPVAVAGRMIEPVRRASENVRRFGESNSGMSTLARNWRDFGPPPNTASDSRDLFSTARVLDHTTEGAREYRDLENQQRRAAKKIDRAMALLLDEALGSGTAQRLR